MGKNLTVLSPLGELKVHFCHFQSLENEWIWMNIWLNFDAFDGLHRAIAFFELIYFRNSFCYRIENSWGSRYESLGHVGPLRKNLNLFVSLGIAEFVGFSELSIYNDVVLLKSFLQRASTANIEEIMKFYNLGNKTFETELNTVETIIAISAKFWSFSSALAHLLLWTTQF